MSYSILQPANIFIAKSNLGVKLIDYGSARRIKNWKEGDMLAIVSYAAFTGMVLEKYNIKLQFISKIGDIDSMEWLNCLMWHLPFKRYFFSRTYFLVLASTSFRKSCQ